MPMIWVEQDVYDEIQDIALIHDFTEIQVLDDILRGRLIPVDQDEQDPA